MAHSQNNYIRCSEKEESMQDSKACSNTPLAVVLACVQDSSCCSLLRASNEKRHTSDEQTDELATTLSSDVVVV